MRTTLTIDDQLLVELKKAAAESGRTMGELVEDALRESLARRRDPATQRPVRLPTFRGGGGLRPGVDLDDTAALLDLMEERD